MQQEIFHFYKVPQKGYGVHPASYSVHTRRDIPGVRRAQLERTGGDFPFVTEFRSALGPTQPPQQRITTRMLHSQR